jgi:chromosome segregation ATPase
MNRINKANPIRKFERWKASRLELLRQIDRLKNENDRLQKWVIVLQQAKDQAETHAEDRRREKEALRAKLASQKKAFESNEQQLGQLAAKITELRAENDKLKRAKKTK